MTRKDALEVFADNLEEIREAAQTNCEYELSQIPIPKLGWYPLYFVQSGYYLLKHKQITDKYKPLLRSVEMKQNPNSHLNELNVDRAKEFPIENLLDEAPRRGMIKCPLHEDKTASCQIKNNKFTCYGCQEYGDVIDLYMKLYNAPFVVAVKALQ